MFYICNAMVDFREKIIIAGYSQSSNILVAERPQPDDSLAREMCGGRLSSAMNTPATGFDGFASDASRPAVRVAFCHQQSTTLTRQRPSIHSHSTSIARSPSTQFLWFAPSTEADTTTTHIYDIDIASQKG